MTDAPKYGTIKAPGVFRGPKYDKRDIRHERRQAGTPAPGATARGQSGRKSNKRDLSDNRIAWTQQKVKGETQRAPGKLRGPSSVHSA